MTKTQPAMHLFPFRHVKQISLNQLIKLIYHVIIVNDPDHYRNFLSQFPESQGAYPGAYSENQ